MADKLVPSQGQVSDREEQLASVLDAAGLLSPLLNASIAQVANEAKAQPKTSSSGRKESYVRGIIREVHPDFTEAQIDDMELEL